MSTRMRVFTLTNLTRNASSQRRIVVQGLDLPARGVAIALAALLPGLILSAPFFYIFGSYGFLMIPITEVAVFWLVESRTRGGLHLRQYQSLVDRKKSNVGVFMCCGVPVEPLAGKWGIIVSSSIPNPNHQKQPIHDYSEVIF